MKFLSHKIAKSIRKTKIYFLKDNILKNYKYNLDYIFCWMDIFKFNNPIILDIGANIGLYSLCYKIKYSNSKIFSFEPQKNIFNIIKKNIRINNLKNIHTFNIGISNKITWGKLSIPKKEIHERYKKNINHGLFSLQTRNKDFKKCKLNTLDNFFLKRKIKKIDFVKIDVEGHEKQVLLGAINLIKKFSPIIQLEYNNLSKKLSRVKKNYYIKFAKKFNYKIGYLVMNYKFVKKLKGKQVFSDIIFYR
jgi:FkbM family methyltransferase